MVRFPYLTYLTHLTYPSKDGEITWHFGIIKIFW